MTEKTILKFSEEDTGIEVESFTEDEVKDLGQVITNSDSNIFAWKLGKNLTSEQIGALLSRYSRTTLTGKKLFLKEFLPNKERGREFFEAWLVDYGDDSIQEMSGGLPMSCEFVSNLAVKEIEDSRMGSYIEKSSRYVFFDKKLPDGEYMFYKDPDIMKSRFADEYVSLMHGLFDSYVNSTKAMVQYIKDKNPFDEQTFRIGDCAVKASELTEEMADRFNTSVEDLQKSYENAVKANALDFMRDYLPMATLTHVGVSMNARSYDSMINKMGASPLAESRWIAKCMFNELEKVAPSLIKRVNEKHGMEFRKFISEKNVGISECVREIGVKNPPRAGIEAVDLVDFTGKGDANTETRAQIALVGIILFKFGEGHSLAQGMEMAGGMKEEQRKEIISRYVGNRQNRRHKPGRIFENVEYLLGLSGRIGIYRDIQRHRIGTQERQDFTVKLGYDIRKEFDDIGIADDYKSKMEGVKEMYGKLHEKLPYQAQYVVTYGFYTRWYYRLNARQLFHLCELRSTPGGHPDYRKMMQEVYYKVREVHPTIASHMKFMDLSDKKLGRLESEIRIAMKKKTLTLKPYISNPA